MNKQATLFWGRMKTIMYPDGEDLTYSYDRGGQLKSMQGVKDNFTYDYLLNQKYDKFGAKTYMEYGNQMVTEYSYMPDNLRLESVVAHENNNPYFTLDYQYDGKGNVTQLTSTYEAWFPGEVFTQDFVYDDADQLSQAECNSQNGQVYHNDIEYSNWGKVQNYTINIVDPQTNMSKDININYQYPTPNNNRTQTVFAPEHSDNHNSGSNPPDLNYQYDFGINGSLRRKEADDNSEYYLFNAFNCMKAYSYNGERYGYYGYDASGERSYKMDINFLGVWTNELEEISDNWELGKMMLYPNGYMNINQSGEYTKHYYADALRIASKIGSGFNGNICDSVNEIENNYPGYLDDRMAAQNSVMMSELYETTLLASLQGIFNIINPYGDFCDLGSGGQENELFYYHPDHLGSTGMITDINSNITQGFVYAPFGEIISEYGGLNNNIPKYAFNAKELDEENGMYYYSARYYAPPTFISRDPMFEKYPSISPYTYCANNPMLYVDPTGKDWVDLVNGGFVYDSRVRSQKDAIKYYGKDAQATSINYSYKSKKGEDVTLSNNGIYTVNGVKHQLKDKATGLSKVVATIKNFETSGHNDGGNDGDPWIQKNVAPVLEGLALLNPLVGIANDIKILATGEDIYGNKATAVDKAVAGVDIVTLGGAKAVKYVGQGVAKSMNYINKVTTGYSAGKTIYEESKKK